MGRCKRCPPGNTDPQGHGWLSIGTLSADLKWRDGKCCGTQERQICGSHTAGPTRARPAAKGRWCRLDALSRRAECGRSLRPV